MNKISRFEWITLVVILFVNFIIWCAVFSIKPRDYVKVSFLDIGQGDSILIESSNRNSVLIDAGPNRKVLDEIGKKFSFFQRNIDILIETHPDKDHIGGEPEVVSRYKIGRFMEPGVSSPNSVDDELKKRINEKGIEDILARAGQIIDMGDGSYIKILFPDRDVSGLETNDASIVAEYFFGDTCFLFTGDSPIKMEDYLVSKYKDALKCDVLKAGHHGSKTSTGDNYLNFVKPHIAIISAGKNNSYGHPHKETLDRLVSHGVKILSTADHGTISMISNGKEIFGK